MGILPRDFHIGERATVDSALHRLTSRGRFAALFEAFTTILASASYWNRRLARISTKWRKRSPENFAGESNRASQLP